jgi:hypothetical protein
MIEPQIPVNEDKRMDALLSYDILDTIFEENFDDIARLASEICNTPISLISLVAEDKQWFKSNIGLKSRETPKRMSFCAHAINTPSEAFIVEDARLDDRFFDNPLVLEDPKIVFYAGIPLVTSKGYALGTLCVIDKKPNKISVTQIKSLTVLSKQVINLLELKLKNDQLKNSYKVLETKNKVFENFTKSALDSISGSINTINLLMEMINKNYSQDLNDKAKKYLCIVNQSSNDMINMVRDVKHYHSSLDLIVCEKETFLVNDLFTEILNEKNNNLIKVEFSHGKLFANKTGIKTILVTLINGLIAQSNDEVVYTLSYESFKKTYCFVINNDIAKLNSDFLSPILNVVKSLDGEITTNLKTMIVTFKK